MKTDLYEENRPSATTNITWIFLRFRLGLHCERPETNRLNYIMAIYYST
jgi:hypothetical protein